MNLHGATTISMVDHTVIIFDGHVYVCSFYPTQANEHRGGSPAIRPPHGFGPLDQRCHSLQYKSLTCVPALLRLSALSSGLLRNFLCCCWVSHWVTTGLTSHQADLSGHSPWLSLSFPVCEHLILQWALRIKNVAKIFGRESESFDSLQKYFGLSWNGTACNLDKVVRAQKYQGGKDDLYVCR